MKRIRDAVGTAEFPQLLFDKVFNADIVRLRTVEDMWKSRKAPEPLQFKTIMSQATEANAGKSNVLAEGQKVWSLEESLVVFNDSLERLSKRVLQLKKTKDSSSPEPVITFDKDDEDTLDFVASSANIRSTIFGIERKSRFDIKQMAGNIIPAIATTNAIVAGLCVLQSFKVLKGEYSKAKEVCLPRSLDTSRQNLLTRLTGILEPFRSLQTTSGGSLPRAQSQLPCLQCLQHDGCHRSFTDYAPRYCRGPYPEASRVW